MVSRSVKKRSVLIAFAAAAGLILVSGFLYSLAAKAALKREIAGTPRDPATGIIQGTEPVTLEGSKDHACLLIHGWVGSRIDFHDLPERLHQRGLTVRMMRLPGHGTTPVELEKMGVDDFLEGARAEYRELKGCFRTVTVIGFSLGGAVAILLASVEDVDRLVLIAPFFDVTYRWYYLLPPETWNRLMRPFLDYAIKGKSFVRVNREEARDHIFSYQVVPLASVEVLYEAGRVARSEEVLSRITCPVLLLHSWGDLAASPEAALDAFSHIETGDQECVLFERSNHHILWDYDGPDAIRRILEFVSKQ